ncbi:hypothetical protein LguiA_028050 [Lonicera macranthoides]
MKFGFDFLHLNLEVEICKKKICVSKEEKVLADLDIWILVEKSSHQKLFKSLNTKMAENLDGLEEKLHWRGVEDEEDGRIFGCKSCFCLVGKKIAKVVWKLFAKVEIIVFLVPPKTNNEVEVPTTFSQKVWETFNSSARLLLLTPITIPITWPTHAPPRLHTIHIITSPEAEQEIMVAVGRKYGERDEGMKVKELLKEFIEMREDYGSNEGQDFVDILLEIQRDDEDGFPNQRDSIKGLCHGLNFELIPFGAGGRGCPGIKFGIANNELALGNLLHKFDVAIPNGEVEDLDMTGTSGITVHKKSPLVVVATPCS